MKNCLKAIGVLALVGTMFGCKVVETETEYVDRIVEKEVEKSRVSSPTFTATSDGGKVNITMTTSTEGATIYYTSDGNEPTNQSTKYEGTIPITADTTFNAIAIKEGMENSSVAFARYSVVNKIETKIETRIEYQDREDEKFIEKEVEVEKEYASAVIFETSATDDGVSITMTTSTVGAAIYYATDGTNPTSESTAYSGVITVTQDTTLKAIAIKAGIENSPISVAKVSITTKTITDTQTIYRDKIYAAPVTFTPTGTDDGISLSLSTTTENARIYYTVGGSEPTAESTKYTAPLELTASTTVKAIAIKDGIEPSPVSVVSVTIKKITEGSSSSGNPLKIELSVPCELSNTTMAVTAKITSASKIKRVVYKKNGNLVAKTLLADNEAQDATEDESDNSVWTFTVDEKATYTVAAIDEAGREETEQIYVQTIDKIAPAEVKTLTSQYSKIHNSIELEWTDPADTGDEYDSPFDHVIITYTIDNGTEVTAVPETVAKGYCLSEITGIDESAEYYVFTVRTVDGLGNISEGKITRCYISNVINATASDVVAKIEAMTQTGTVKVTGAITTTLLKNISSAIKKLANGIYVNLDLGETTGLTAFVSAGSASGGQFYYCDKLQSIILPNTLKSVSDYAFYNCSGLTSVTIPNSVTTIGTSAFTFCTSLTSITIPDSVTSISKRAFESCRGLTSIIIPNSVTNIGEYAFTNCSGLTSVTIGSGLKCIETYMFASCTGLTSVTIPDNVTSIKDNAFSGCTELTSVTIGNGVTSIGNKPFYNCKKLAGVIFADTESEWFEGYSYGRGGTSIGSMSATDTAANLNKLNYAYSSYCFYNSKYSAE